MEEMRRGKEKRRKKRDVLEKTWDEGRGEKKQKTET